MDDRRSGTDRRRPGRPPSPEGKGYANPRPVRLDLEIDDKLCRLSLRHDIAVNALLKLAATRLVKDVEAGVIDLSAIGTA